MMTTDHDPNGTDGSNEKDMVAQLMKAAGRREDPPPGAYDQVLNAATAAWRSKVRARRYRQMGGLMAACLVLAIAVTVIYSNRTPQPTAQVAVTERIIGTVEMRDLQVEDWSPLGGEQRALLVGSSLRTMAGSRLGMVLTNGVSLRLADATELTLETPSQILLHTGKVYIDSGSDRTTARQVQVQTPLGTARDVGTQFEVLYQDDRYRLRVREGRVLLRRDGREINNAAGEQVAIDATGGVQRARIARDDPDWQWVQSLAPAPEIEGQPITVLLKWVARETGRAIQFEAPALERQAASTILHGNIRHLAPMEALEVMLATTDFEYGVLEDGTIEIRSKVNP